MSETVTLSAYGVRTKVMAKITKEVGNTKITPIRRARACTANMPEDMTVVGHLSVADLLNQVVLRSIPVQRNDDFTVEADHVIMSTDTFAYQNA